MSKQRTVPVAGSSVPAAGSDPDTDPRRESRRRRTTQIIRLTADGTGRSEVEVQWLVVTTGVSVLRAGAVETSIAALWLINFMVDA